MTPRGRTSIIQSHIQSPLCNSGSREAIESEIQTLVMKVKSKSSALDHIHTWLESQEVPTMIHPETHQDREHVQLFVLWLNAIRAKTGTASDTNIKDGTT